MKKILLMLILSAFIAAPARGQNEGTDYRTALGLKFYPAGVTFKRFVTRRLGLEAIGYSHEGFRLTLLAEYYSPVGSVAGFNWYVGPGLHAGFHNNHWIETHRDVRNNAAFGIDGILGVDYKVKGLPLNVSLDWQPSYNLVGENLFEGGWGGVGVRYAF